MNNSTWRSEDGQLLRRLREDARIDELVFARTNTVSLAQLRDLEEGGSSSFYNLSIKRSTGVKLLKKLGHTLVPPIHLSQPEQPTEQVQAESVFSPVAERTPVLTYGLSKISATHRNASVRGVIQHPGVWILGLLTLALLAAKPWTATDSQSKDSSDPFPYAMNQPILAPTTNPTTQATKATLATAKTPSAQEKAAAGLAPDVPVQTLPPTGQLAAKTLHNACDWQHIEQSKTHTPHQPLKPGNYVHFEAQADTELCVLDSLNQKTMVQMKAGMVKSVYGSAPFLVHSQDWQNLKLFFQGRRVIEALDDANHLLLKSQPL